MSLSPSFIRFLTERRSRRSDPCVKVLIWCSCFFGLCGLVFGINEYHQSNTYVERYCQIKSNEVVGPLKKSRWKPAWNITILDEGNDRIESSSTYSLKWWATSIAQAKKLNQIYRCYRHHNYPSPGTWSWQWNKPSKLKAYSFLFAFSVFFIVGSVLFILRKYYQHQERRRQ
ncbi:unnamed protein product [Adineta steineri]|uniref:Uncharacterized protein n=1 Tax=Adineta steineri TaxID=433720 RepID=A0A813SFH9_9BILA|nr:unnamed protein product [Adineta steineri]CAF0793872.1 unnamed protein product [Adineta steineri]